MSNGPVQLRLNEVLHQSELAIERAKIAMVALRIPGDPYEEKFIGKFLSKVAEHENGCWLWQSTLNNNGYARIYVHKRPVLAHRWTYILLRGEIAKGLELDHLCKCPNCVNPDHLEAVTHRENNLRSNSPSAIHARTTHCPEGHPLNEQNTYVYKQRNGRECRICKTRRTVESNRRMKALRKNGGQTA